MRATERPRVPLPYAFDAACSRALHPALCRRAMKSKSAFLSFRKWCAGINKVQGRKPSFELTSRFNDEFLVLCELNRKSAPDFSIGSRPSYQSKRVAPLPSQSHPRGEGSFVRVVFPGARAHLSVYMQRLASIRRPARSPPAATPRALDAGGRKSRPPPARKSGRPASPFFPYRPVRWSHGMPDILRLLLTTTGGGL